MLSFSWMKWSRQFSHLGLKRIPTKRKRVSHHVSGIEQCEDRAMLSAVSPPPADNSIRVSWAAATATTVEGDTGTTTLTLKVVASSASTTNDIKIRGVIESFGTGAGHADRSDFQATPFQAVIKKGETSADVTVTVIGDTLIEGDEKFQARLVQASRAQVINPISEINIQDNDTPANGHYGVSLVAGKPIADVEGTQAPYTLHLSAPSATPIDVVVMLNGAGPRDKGAATIPDDATINGAAQGTITIPAGVTDHVFNVTLVDDTLVEKPEGYAVTIVSATNSTQPVGITSVQGIIRDNDQPPKVSIAKSTRVTEGNTGTTNAEVVVTLERALTSDVVINYSTKPAKSNNGKNRHNKQNKQADATDFTPVQKGSVTIPAGQTSAKINVAILGDTTVEQDESFHVVLQGVSSKNARIAGDSERGEVIIVNDDLTSVT